MAVRRGFGVEKRQLGELKEPADSQNSKAQKPENVDALVNRFLAELSDLSSEMSHSGGNDNRSAVPPQAATSDANLERISREIEESLSKLESLKPAAAPIEDKPVAVGEKPAPPPAYPDASAQVSVPPPAVSNEAEEGWKELDIFRSQLSAPKPAPRFSIAWVIAGAVLLGILGVAGFYFFGSDDIAPSEITEPGAVPGVQAPQAPEPSTPANEDKGQKGRTATEPVKPAPVDKAKVKPPDASPSREAAKTSETGKARVNGLVLAPETKRATAAAPVNFAEEQAKPSPVQGVAAASSSPPVNIVVVPPSPAPVQPKPQPPAADSGLASPAAAGSPEPKEAAPPAPKTIMTAAASPEVAVPKPHSVLQAEAIKKVSPVYPALARSRKIVGVVDVETEINDNGEVFRAVAVSGPPMLRPAAEEALRKWKFKPASVNGVSVSSKARISVNFSLQ